MTHGPRNWSKVKRQNRLYRADRDGFKPERDPGRPRFAANNGWRTQWDGEPFPVETRRIGEGTANSSGNPRDSLASTSRATHEPSGESHEP